MSDVLAAMSARFLANRHELMAYLMSLDPDPVLAEDILQEVWLALAKEAAEGRLIHQLPAWCRAVGRHAWIKQRRAQRRERPDDAAVAELLDRAFAQEPREPEAWSQQLQALRSCLERLGAPARHLLQRRYVDDADTATLAGELAAAEETVLMRLSRVRGRLRQCVEGRLGGADGT